MLSCQSARISKPAPCSRTWTWSVSRGKSKATCFCNAVGLSATNSAEDLQCLTRRVFAVDHEAQLTARIQRLVGCGEERGPAGCSPAPSLRRYDRSSPAELSAARASPLQSGRSEKPCAWILAGFRSSCMASEDRPPPLGQSGSRVMPCRNRSHSRPRTRFPPVCSSHLLHQVVRGLGRRHEPEFHS